MNNDFDFSFFNPVLLILIIVLFTVLKYFLFRKLRHATSKKRLLKTFFRWYGSSEIDLAYDHPRKQQFMRLSNWINIPYWAILLILIAKIAILLLASFPDIN